MKLNRLYILAVFPLLFTYSSCSFEDQFDPNGASLGSILTEATAGELNLLVTGIEGRMRNGWGTYVTATGSVARELYLFDADPRNTEELLGKEGATLDNNTFYLTAPFNTRYTAIKNCNLLLDALRVATGDVDEMEKDAYRGFANTIKGLMLSQVLALLGDNGVRIDVADVDNIGPFIAPAMAYDMILDIMDDGAAQLQGSTILFNLSDGFEGFMTADKLFEFNRALAARIAIQGGLYDRALTYVNSSFLELNGAIDVGPEHIFSANAGDILNPVFRPPGQSGDQIIVHPRIVPGLMDGDTRISKFALRVDPSVQDGLTSDYESALYASVIAPIDIIRNEELIIIYAEASLQEGAMPDAVAGFNALRAAHSLPAYSGPMTVEALTDELLYHRTYSLWGEGQQLFDLRRYDRLNTLPIDRAGDQVFSQFPIPLSEGV
ncbi:MAG: RagB/SusD family nutrient uptake outer membrane protein [Bacteroidota bacterium]